MGAERRSSYIDEKVKRLTAYHEGGHALTALYTDGAMPLHKVTCVPRGHALGVVGLIRYHRFFSTKILTMWFFFQTNRRRNYRKTIG
jgi:ATP-dependent Zn protease